jgi:hypothetical protein
VDEGYGPGYSFAPTVAAHLFRFHKNMMRARRETAQHHLSTFFHPLERATASNTAYRAGGRKWTKHFDEQNARMRI